MFYLATLPSLYGPAARNLSRAGLAGNGARIVLEKPVGQDFDSARRINDEVGRYFAEENIFRIDHYLGKETVQNLMALRFANSLMEPLWRRAAIDHVQITVAEQLGTGHAVAQALPHLEEDVVLVLYGDVPLIQPQTLRDFVARVDDQSLALMTLTLDDPSGYGRVIRDGDGKVRRVVEQKDASDDEKAVREINTGILACTRRFLNDSLPRLSNSNAQGEYYLTDLIAMAVDAGMEVVTEQPGHAWEVDGVNDRVQLARLERVYQRVRAESLMRAGVTLLDPARLDIRGNLQCGQDVTLDINTVLVGDVGSDNLMLLATVVIIMAIPIVAWVQHLKTSDMHNEEVQAGDRLVQLLGGDLDSDGSPDFLVLGERALKKIH